jgi:hypothetical protein
MVTYSEFRTLLLEAINKALEAAERYVAISLPENLVFLLDAADCSNKILTLDDVATQLYVDGSTPKLVNVGVHGIVHDSSVIWIAPTGFKSVDTLSETVSAQREFGPFQVVGFGLIMPKRIWDRPRPYSLQDLEDAVPKRFRDAFDAFISQS